MSQDNALIEKLGGPTRVAELLGYDKAGGPQRVHNWTKRGIPAAVKVSRPDLFLPGAPALSAAAELLGSDGAPEVPAPAEASAEQAGG